MMSSKSAIELIDYAKFLPSIGSTFSDAVRYIVDAVNTHERECVLRVGSLPVVLDALCEQYTWKSAGWAHRDLDAICFLFALQWTVENGLLIVTAQE